MGRETWRRERLRMGRVLIAVLLALRPYFLRFVRRQPCLLAKMSTMQLVVTSFNSSLLGAQLGVREGAGVARQLMGGNR